MAGSPPMAQPSIRVQEPRSPRRWRATSMAGPTPSRAPTPSPAMSNRSTRLWPQPRSRTSQPAASVFRKAASGPEGNMSDAFSRIIRVDSIPEEGQIVALEATAAEREALATLYEQPSIEALTASLFLEPAPRGAVRVTGAMHACLTQVCVVSLEPFPATIDEEIDVRFVPRAEGTAGTHATHGPPSSSMAEEDEP